MSRTSSRLALTLALIVLVLAGGITAATAGTTGALSGRVFDTASQAPIAGAKVTATSPSGTSTTTADKNGAFTFISLTPDTYTLTVSAPAYDAASLSGITVQADQTVTYSVSLVKRLQQIGRVSSRSSASLIQPGISTDVYNISAVQQGAAATLGGGGGLNNAYSAVASVPGVFVPQGQVGQYQSIFVRGANYTQVGYEYDGVPIQRAFDQYPGSNLSNLGTQEVQVYTGTAPTGTGSTALAGFVNQVIRTGTFPGFANAVLSAGSPVPYSSVRVEGGGSSPNRLFNYYVGVGGYNQNIVYESGTQFDATYGGLLDVYRANCGTAHPTAGCYKVASGPGGSALGPNGYELGPLFWGASTLLVDRDNVANVHLGIPHRINNDGGKDDIQLLGNVVLTQTYFATSPYDWGKYYGQVITGTAGGNQPCSAAVTTNCNRYGAVALNYIDKLFYRGATGAFLQPGDVTNTQLAYFPNSPTNRGINAPIAAYEDDNYQQNGAIFKVQYQRNFNSRSYARLAAYTEYSDWLQYGMGGVNPNFYGSISADYKLGSHTRGLDFNYANQLSDKHLLNFTAAYVTSNTFRNNDSGYSNANSVVAYMVDSRNPTAGVCYGPAGGAGISCTASATNNPARYLIPSPTAPSSSLVPAAGSPSVATAATLTCGSGPCAYLVVANGNSATYNTVTPKFSTLALSDKWQVTPRLSLDLGLRYDDFKYALTSTTGDAARTFWVNNFNAFNCYDSFTQSLVAAPSANGCGALNAAGSTRYTQAQFSAVSAPFEDYPEWQPRFGGTYTVNRNDVVRFSYGKTAQPSSSAFQQYNTIQPNLISANTPFYSLGFTNPSHHIVPEESYNYDASWEHQFSGTNASFKLTPYLRTTNAEISTVLLDPKTNFVSGINIGHKNVKGLEFEIQKGDLNRNGLYGQLSYTYTFARIRFDKTPKGTTVVDGLNNSIKQYNAYTSFCAANPGDPRCTTGSSAGSAVSWTTKNMPAAACFTPSGASDPACAAGDIANPYWNAAPQGLFDPGAMYPLYNTYAGTSLYSGSNQTYIPSHVLTFIGNYKHNRFNVTPTLQFQGGGQYGVPLAVAGVNPAGGCAALPGSAATTAGDPRYAGAAIAARPYDASSCAAGLAIPDPYTHRFDPYGAFTEPNKLSGNLSVSYDVSRRATVRLDMVNVLASCFGGSKVPWSIGGNAGCDYRGYRSVGNFYNPGDAIQTIVQYPYGPNFGNVFQSTTGGQANPFQLFMSVNLKI